MYEYYVVVDLVFSAVVSVASDYALLLVLCDL